MNQFKVTFLPYDISIDVDAGKSLIRAAMAAGVHINASCGGEGVCGKCRVKVEQAMWKAVSQSTSPKQTAKRDTGWPAGPM